MHETLPPDTPPGPHKHVSSSSNGAQSEAVSWLILLALSWLMGFLGPLPAGSLRELAIDKFARSLGAGIGLLAIFRCACTYYQTKFSFGPASPQQKAFSYAVYMLRLSRGSLAYCGTFA
jgi:hypothetical protein